MKQLKQRADSLLAQGVSLQELRQFENATAAYIQAVVLYDSLGENDSLGVACENLGFVFRDAGKYDSALVYHRRSLAARQAAHDEKGEALSLNNIGECYQYLSEYEKAIKYFNRSLAIVARRRLEEGMGVLMTNVALNQTYLGQYKASNKQYAKALKIHEKVGNKEGKAKTLIGLGFNAFHQKKYADAEKYYRPGLKLLRELSLSADEAASLGNLALVYNAQGRRRKAIATANEARAKAENVGDLLDAGVALYKLGIISVSSRKYSDALRYLQDAEVVFKQLKLKEREGMVYAQQLRAYKWLNNPTLAILVGKNAVNAFQDVRSRIRNLDPNTQKEFLATKEETYRELAALLIDEGRLAEAEIVLNMLKENEYFEFLRGQQTSATSLKVPLTTGESTVATQRIGRMDNIVALSATYTALRRKAATGGLSATDQQKLKESEVGMEREKRELLKFLAEIARTFVRSGDAEQTAAMFVSQGIITTLRELGQGTVAIYTLVGQTKYYSLLVTPKGRMQSSKRITAASFNRTVAEFRKALSDPVYDPRPNGKVLYDIIVRPFRKVLTEEKATTIMWNLSGSMRYIPMAALFDGKEFMVQQYRNSLFTLTSLSRLNSPSSRNSKVLGLGVSEAHEGFRGLPFVPKELHGIIRTAEDDTLNGVLPGVVRLDREFNRDTLMNNLERKFPIVHIATHFEFIPGDETKSFLLLGDGSRLRLDQLRNSSDILFDGVDLLTLSACNTATGGGGRGNEVESFAELAQNLQAKSVLATLWPVYDASTAILMELFYRLRETQPRRSKAEALQAAQLALLEGKEIHKGTFEDLFAAQRGGDNDKANPSVYFPPDRQKPFAHPFYWAPFVLIGNWK